jgi:hypothetical protein
MELDRYAFLGDLTAETLDYFKSLHIVRVDEFVPYYHAAFGCHVLNLMNRRREHPLYARTGSIPDLRLNIFFVGPPGFSKSYFCDIHFDNSFGVAPSFPNREVSYMTLPGLIGSVYGKDDDGNVLKEQGVAETFKEHIIWCEEFTSISEVMKAEHSAGMSGLLLQLTDNGKVSRDMKFGHLEYQSFATLFLGTQTERLDLISGLSRRFLFLDLNPDAKDIQDYNKAWEEGEGIEPDWKTITNLREGWAMVAAGPPNLSHIALTPEYLKFRESLPIIHIDKDVLNRLAIGWNLVNTFKWNDKVLEVAIPTELQRLIFSAIEMKYSILGQTKYLAINKILADGAWHPTTEITWKLVELGVGSYSAASARIREMLALRLLEQRQEKQEGPGRPRMVLRLVRKEGI